MTAAFPVILGEGIPLLAPGGRRESLKLEAQKTHTNGVVTLRYSRLPL